MAPQTGDNLSSVSEVRSNLQINEDSTVPMNNEKIVYTIILYTN